MVEELPLRGFALPRFRNTRYGSLFPPRAWRPSVSRRTGADGLQRARLDVKPVVFLAGQRQHGLAKGALDGGQGLPICLLFLGATLCFNDAVEVRLERRQGLD